MNKKNQDNQVYRVTEMQMPKHLTPTDTQATNKYKTTGNITIAHRRRAEVNKHLNSPNACCDQSPDLVPHPMV